MKKLSPSEKKEWQKWVTTRPEHIQELIKKYPPGEYIIKPNAPYGVAYSGTKVFLYSYTEDNRVGVIVTAKNKLPQALEHEKYLCQLHNRTEKDRIKIHKQDIICHIDPVWLEFIQ